MDAFWCAVQVLHGRLLLVALRWNKKLPEYIMVASKAGLRKIIFNLDINLHIFGRVDEVLCLCLPIGLGWPP